MKNFYKKLINKIRWASALSRASGGEDEKALSIIGSIDVYWVEDIRAELQVLKTALYLRVNALGCVATSADLALIQIEQSSYLSKANKRYLSAFTLWHKRRVSPDCEEDLEILIPRIDLSQIDPWLKQHFPLRCHSAWDDRQ